MEEHQRGVVGAMHYIKFFYKSWFSERYSTLGLGDCFRVKAKECVCACVYMCVVGLRRKMCLHVTGWTFVVSSHLGYFFFFYVAFLSCCLPNLYASSSKPMPTLCPPPFTLFPSIIAERVSFTPAGASVKSVSQETIVTRCCCYRKHF